MRLFTWLRKFGTYYRKHGFLWLCRHIITNLVNYNRLVILESEIHPDHEIIEAKIPVNIRLLSKSEEDIKRLTNSWPDDEYVPPFSTPQMIKDVITKRLAAGEVCMIAEYKRKFVHMNWIGFHGSHIFDRYEEKRGINPNEALSHSIYCADTYRGNHIMSAVCTKVFDILLENNVNKMVCYVDPDNRASMKVFKNFGGKPVQKLYNLKILGFYLNYLSKRTIR